MRVVTLDGQPRVIRTLTANVSSKGMFVRMPEPLPTGTRVALSLEAGGRALALAQAEVVWQRLNESELPGRFPGCGVRFTDFLHPRAQELVDYLVDNLDRGKPLTAAPPERQIPRWIPAVAITSLAVVAMAAILIFFAPSTSDDLLPSPPEEKGDAISNDSLAAAEPRADSAEIQKSAVANETDAANSDELTSSAMKRVDLESVTGDARGSDVKSADLKSTNATGADVKGADANAADDKGADVKGADVRGTDAKGAEVKGAEVKGAEVKIADATGADVKGAEVKSADGKGDEVKSAEVKTADVKAADVKGAEVKGTDVKGADVKNDEKRADVKVAVKPEVPVKGVDAFAAQQGLPSASSSSAKPRSGTVALPSGAAKTLKWKSEGAIVRLDPDATLVRAFVLDGPPRAVFDLDGGAPMGSHTMPATFPHAKSVRIGKQGKGTRVVVDLDQAPSSSKQTGGELVLSF